MCPPGGLAKGYPFDRLPKHISPPCVARAARLKAKCLSEAMAVCEKVGFGWIPSVTAEALASGELIIRLANAKDRTTLTFEVKGMSLEKLLLGFPCDCL